MARPSLIGFFLFNTFEKLLKAHKNQCKSSVQMEVRLHVFSDRCDLYCASASVPSLFLLKSGYRTHGLEGARLAAWN